MATDNVDPVMVERRRATRPSATAVTVTLRDVQFDALSEAQAAAEIMGRWQQGEGGWVSTPNTHQLELVSKSEQLRDLVDTASLTLADGMPLVWASQLQGTPLPERVAGSNLVWSLARAGAAAGASLFLLGGDDGVGPRAQAVLERAIPGIKIVGTYSPPLGFESDPAELERIRQVLADAEPDLVYVGLGFPKQEQLISVLTPSLPSTWFLGIGMSLSFISGDMARAPGWMQRAGLEWVHRLLSEPQRLFARYVLHGIPFTCGLLLRSSATRALASRLAR
jgi:N-acetylglucosaminyldiphosphoundecaprenol N-acetyl-beta-D-mannosaminyltransferase